jgi:hypothetical protein
VDHTIKADSQTGVALPAQHAGRGEKASEPGETRIPGVVIGHRGLYGGHVDTLTVEPRFKSSGPMPERLTIGEVGERARVATSTERPRIS